MIRDLPLDAVEAVNNAGFFSAPFNAWAALRNLGCDADALRRALLAGRTSAHVDWSWTAGKLPLHLAMQLRAAYRFLRRDRQRVHVDTLP